MAIDAAALGAWLMMASPDSVQFNWPAIQQCAARPIPAPKPQADGGYSMLSPEWKEYEFAYQTITLCRNLLAARHAGWQEAAPNVDDPLPPELMMRPDDMK
jgi:hypothetical protein